MTGEVSLGIIESLPFDGIHLILGNDLAGDKVKANPILTNKPCLSQQPDPVEQVFSELYPSCAMKKRQEFEHETGDKQAEEIIENSGSTGKNETNNDQSSFSKSNLIKEQQNDPEISVLYQKASHEIEAAVDPKKMATS